MYKIGDKVTIISLEKALKWDRFEHNGVCFAPPMMLYCGKTTTITGIRHCADGSIGYHIALDEYWNWIDGMFEQESKEPEISFF